MENPLPQLIEERRGALVDLCRRHHVDHLDLFGSAADGRFDPMRSDLDFLVEFEADAGPPSFSQIFALQSDLERLFGREIDLFTDKPFRNPYLKRQVERQRRRLFPAHG